jgi:FAD/FMN-containing dehydrogenase
MATTTAPIAPGLAAAQELRMAMQGKVLLPSDTDYARARRIWNGAVCRYPALFARCETVDDVCAAISAARTHRLPLSVRGGGHDWAGRSLCQNGLVIDLSAMRQVRIDADRRVATVAGGATARDVATAAAHHGLVAVTGNCGDVGMAGLTLGGGYGLLSSRYGLAADNLLGAEIVLPDGHIVVASAHENADLFWALRGGGGNFGVVTSLQIGLHPARELLAGLILFPWRDADAVLRGYAQTMQTAPDDLAVLAGMLSTPDGEPALFLAPAWSGRFAEGAAAIAALQRLGEPLHTQIAPMSYTDLLAMFDAHVVSGQHYAIQTRWLAKLTPAAIAELVAAGEVRSSPLSLIAMHHLHGAASRIPPAATAFHLRQEHFLVEIVASWQRNGEAQRAVHQEWARRLSNALEPAALPGGYANLLGPNEKAQICAAYGRNAERLLKTKQKFDPDGVFSAIPLPV